MEEKLNDAHGRAFDAGMYGGVADVVTVLNRLNESMNALIHAAYKEDNPHQKFLDECPNFAFIDVDTLPRKLKKSYWKVFEHRPITERERNRLKKLSGRQVTAKTPE